MSAAFMTASNSGPLKGQSLEKLVTHFVAELLEYEQYVKLEEMDTVAWTDPAMSKWKAELPVAV